ncbi:MAG: phosphoribosylglycinamide formyltransferase [Syntrophomonadaceae bacterium]|jgi:phosphoribosylglycinamide formyltransferase-1
MIRIMEPRKLNLAVLASGRGSNFEAIHNAIVRKDLEAQISILISDKEQAAALKKATERDIPALFINPHNFTNREEYETEMVKHLMARNVDLIVLAGYMRLVGQVLLKAYKHRIVNIHPALLPSFPGLHAQKQAVEYGVRFSGCTVHFVDEGMDTGPIILQSVVPVRQEDDEDSLAERILVEEHNTYWRAIQLIAEGKVYIDKRKVYIKEV